MNVSNSAHSGEVLRELNSQRERAELTDVVLEVGGRRFNQVALQPSFLQLPLALLQSLLNRDDLLTNSEDDVVQAALRWVEFDQEERLRHLPNLCRSFRRSFLSSKQLVDLEKKCPSTDIKLVYSDSTTQRLGQERTEMQIFLRDDSTMSAPCYDPSTGELYTMNMPDDMVGYSMAVTPGDELYVAGGVVNCGKTNLIHEFKQGDFTRSLKSCKKLKTFYQYNHLFKTWEQRCDMISPRVRCGLVYLKGYIYAIGGDDAKKTAERYDPSRDEWTSIPPLPHPMCQDFCAVPLGDNIYVIGEFEEGCLSFSTTDSTWNKIANRNMPAPYPQVVVYQGSIYCTGNLGPIIRTPVEIYNPANDEWKQSGKYGFASHATILTRYGETLYLLKLRRNRNLYATRTSIDINQYQPETDSWQSDIDSGERQSLQDNCRLVAPPIARWLGSMGLRHTLQVHCLTARMVPECLRHYGTEIYKDPPDHGEEGSGISGDSLYDSLSHHKLYVWKESRKEHCGLSSGNIT